MNTPIMDEQDQIERLKAQREQLRKALASVYGGHVRVMHARRDCDCPFWDETRTALKETETL